MKKIFEKHEALFCMLLIFIYVAVNSVCVQNFGYTGVVSFIVNTILSASLMGIVLLLILENDNDGEGFRAFDKSSKKESNNRAW